MFDINSLDKVEKKWVDKILAEFSVKNKSRTYNRLIRSDFIREPVSPREFFTSEFYYGKGVEKIYPIWLDELCYVCDPLNGVTEWIISGSIGGGKSTSAMRAIFYKIYELSCMISPQDFFGLLPGHRIVFGIYNIFKYKAAETTFPILKTLINSSPYFQQYFQSASRRKSLVEFPNNIEVMSGSEAIDMIGDNVFSLVIDEANFMKDDGDTKAQAYDIYSSALSRMESRFIAERKIKPWLLIIVSSKKHQSDFTTTRVEELKKKGHGGRITEYPIWVLKPKETYSGRKFRVFIGDATRASRIIGENDFLPEGAEFVDVPIEYKEIFETNPDKALNDIAGIATMSSKPLITRKEALMECLDTDRSHPFITESIFSNFKESDPIEDYLKIDELTKIENSRRVPKVNPHIPREIHVDIGLTGDALGFAMCHSSGVKLVQRVSPDGNIYQASETIIYVDMMLQIIPDGEIDLTSIRMFIVFLNQVLGYDISTITYDGFQSRESIQLLKKLSYNVELLSVDRTIEPYSIFQRAILEGRVSYYRYAPMMKEIINLIWDKRKDKVDHPIKFPDGTRGGKDICDALAACVFKCIKSDSKNTYIEGSLPELPKQEPQLNVSYMPRNPLSSDVKDISWIYADADKKIKKGLDIFFKKD